MDALLYFLFWALFIFVMMRFGCGSHIMGRGHGKAGHGGGASESSENSNEMRWVPPASDIDPVCGKTVRTETARPSVHDGAVYYFCSRECREIFEVAPDQYVGGANSDHPKLEHSHV